MEDTDKYKVMKFSGKRADFSLWKDRFLAHCCVKECDDVVLNDDVVPADSKALTENDADLLKYRKDNKKAYGILINLVSDPSSINAVLGAKTTELPRGCVRTAFKNLEKLYDIKNEDVKHELQQKFNKSELISNDKNPDIWFSQLETWRLRLMLDYKVDITEADLVNHIIYNLKAKIYETNILIIKRENSRNKNKISLEDLKDEIRQTFTSYKTTSKTQQNNPAEVSMVAATKPNNNQKPTKKFKGDCRICGIKGHKAADCWGNEKNKDKRPDWYKEKGESANLSTGQAPRGNLNCTYCGKNNHTVDRCFKKEKDDKKALSESTAVSMIVVEAGMVASSANVGKQSATLNHHSFIADSGASSHMRFSKEGMTELQPYVVEVKVGNAETIYSTDRGKFTGTVIQRDGSRSEIELKDVLLVPKLWTNLFSITRAIDNPKIGSGKTDDNLIKIIPEDRQPIVFDKVIPTGKSGGRLLALDIVPKSEHCALSTCSPSHMHNILSHANDAVVKATAKKLAIKLVGPTLTCESCARSKAKVKRFNKESKAPPAKHLGDRIHFDLCTMKYTAYGGYKNWLLIQDEFTKFIWSKFLKLKSDLPQTMLEWTTGEEKKGSMVVSKYRCDNAPEHYTFQQLIKSEVQTHKTFQFTAPHTPEHNGRVERKYATLFGKVRAMLNEALLPAYLRNLLWARAASCASKVENIIVNEETEKSPHELVYGENPPWVKSLRTFGEIAILQVGGTTKKIKAKLENRGIPALFVDYPIDHASDVYVFMKLDNRQIVLSRNYTWLNKLYGEYKGIKQVQITQHIDWSDDEDEEKSDPIAVVEEENEALSIQEEEAEIEVITVNEDEEENEEELPNRVRFAIDNEAEDEEERPRRVSGLQRDLYHLRCDWNPDPERFVENEQAEIAFSMIEMDVFPRTFREAMKRSDKKKWKEAFWNEFENIENKKVWQFFEKKNLPMGRKIIGNRWVNVIKDDGRYRSRTVAKGFSQIPGKDHQENHAPVIHDTTFHMVLCFKLYYKLHKRQFDVETAFLYGDLEEELYMEFPEGYEEFLLEKGIRFEASKHCLLLKKSLYGLVQ
ncbi:MAG: reverse transcriptase domain-containing protein, partial [Lactococcus lactis]